MRPPVETQGPFPRPPGLRGRMEGSPKHFNHKGHKGPRRECGIVENSQTRGKMNIRKKSQELHARASRVIPGGVDSPVRAFKSVGGDPPYIVRGQGAHIWDADGNEYIDYVGSWGPLILGHAFPS